MTMLELYFFHQEIKNKINESTKNKKVLNSMDCYLINENWFSHYTQFYYYNEIYQHLIRENKYKDKDKGYIIDKLLETFSYKFQNNNNGYPLLEDKEKFIVDFKLNYERSELIFNFKYIIINKNIIRNIISDKFDFNSIKTLKMLFNIDKIIIENEEKNTIFIGTLSKNIYNLFIPEIVLKYDDLHITKKQFNKFEIIIFSNFEKELNISLKDKINDLFDEEDKNKKIGKTFKIDRKKYDKINEFKENILQNLYDNEEILKILNKEKCYIINNEYIKAIKILLNYEEYLKINDNIQNKNNKIPKYSANKNLNKNKSFYEIDKNKIKAELTSSELLKVKKVNLQNDNLFHPVDFEIISEKLKECLMDYDFLQNDLELIETKGQIKNGKVILIPNLTDKNFVFIYDKNNMNEYMIEYIYEFNDKEKIENYFNATFLPQLKFENKKCEILDKEGKPLGIAYEIKKSDENEIIEDIKIKDDILIMIKIYLYNKDLCDKKSLSKHEKEDKIENQKEKIFIDKCFLIDKEKMDLYKEHCLYEELKNYLNDNSDKFKIIKDSKENIYSSDNINTIYKFLEDTKFLEKYKEKVLYNIDKTMFDIKRTSISDENNNININYYDDYIIVNKDIFQQIYPALDNNKNEFDYIINSGKTIIFFEEENTFQVIIGNFELLINFKNNNEFINFKKNLLKEKYYICIENLNKNEVSIYDLNKNYFEIIRNLAILYINFEKSKQRLNNTELEIKSKYCIVNKKWIEYLKNIYAYDKIISKLKENNEFNNFVNEFINEDNQNKEKKGIFDNQQESRLLNLIKKIFQNEDSLKLNNKDLSSILISKKKEECKISKLGNKEISFYDGFVVINQKFIQALKKLKYIKYSNNIYIYYSINENYLINVGELDDDLIFNTKIVIKAKNKEIQEEIIDIENIKNKIQKLIDDFIMKDNSDYIDLKNSKNEILGTAYKLIKKKEKLISKDNKNKENIMNDNKKEKNFDSFRHKKSDKIDMKNINTNYLRNAGRIGDKNKKYILSTNKTFNKENIGNKMIKLFFLLYLNYQEVEKNISNNIKSNKRRQYYLINKDFMKIYKEYYDYNKISEYFKTEKGKQKLDIYYDKIISSIKKKLNYDNFIYEIIKTMKDDILVSLENKKINQDNLIKKLKENESKTNSYSIEQLMFKIDSTNKVKYYGENEIISSEFIDIFNQIETDKIKSIIKKEIVEVFIGDENIYIISDNKKYPFLNIGHYDENIFKPFLLIYYKEKEDFDIFISELSLWSFNDFIKKYDIRKNNIINIKDNFEKIIGKICKLPQNYDMEIDIKPCESTKEKKQEKLSINKNIDIQKINSESIKLLKLIIYFKRFAFEKKTSIKIKELKTGYTIKMDYFEKIKKLTSYQIIEEYISKNDKIQNILENDLKNHDIDNHILIQKIIKEFNEETIKEINLNKKPINIISQSDLASKELIVLNKARHSSTYAQIRNNFILLNEEIYKEFRLIDSNNFYRDKIKYIIGDNRIFILSEEFSQMNTILVFKNNNNDNKLELDLILYYNIDVNLGFNSIKNNGMEKFLSFLLFDNDLVSPIFDTNQKMIGTAYKYDSKIKNYTELNINFEIRKMFVLYLNYKILKYKTSSAKKDKNKDFKGYYIINKDWIQEYKNYYNFDMICSELDKIPQVQQVFNSLNDNEKIGNLITDKKLTLMIKALPKYIIENFNESELYFKTKFNNTNKKLPQITGFEYYDNNNKEQSLFYSYDFEIISEEIYEYLFKYLDMNINSVSDREIRNFLLSDENEGKVDCLFDKKRVIIKFDNKSRDAGNKYIIYIGKLNSLFIYEPVFNRWV